MGGCEEKAVGGNKRDSLDCTQIFINEGGGDVGWF